MSRFCGPVDTAAILEAAAHWKEQALRNSDSVLAQSPLWTLTNIEAVETHFVNRLDMGAGDFFSKLRTQLEPTAPAVKQLAAEMLWLMLLCPSNISPAKKRESIQSVWAWSGEKLSADSPWLHDAVLTGVGSAGTSFNTNRWRELVFFVNFLLAFKRLPAEERERLLSDGWALAAWLEDIPDAKSRQLRHMLLFLLFPDDFDRVLGGIDRRKIVAGFTGKSGAEVKQMSPLEIDRAIHAIRVEQQEAHGTTELDFYIPPLNTMWTRKPIKSASQVITRDHVLEALLEIDEEGVPHEAQSTYYDLVHGAERYPPKYVLSLASRHATGEELDRALFAGGEASPAFRLLRELGFYVERKDFVPELLKAFLEQANAAESLVSKGYPSTYRGLDVNVSFGKGTLAKVPWISFTGEDQTTQKGIYPGYLYFKAAGTLLLTYVVSETNPPDRQWPASIPQQTVADVLASQFGHQAERYGDSFVHAVYPTSEALNPEQLTKDLDQVVAAFEAAMQAYPTPVFEGENNLEEGAHMAARTYPVNLIYYGPPGTGKTYTTIETAVGICDGHVPADRAAVVKLFKELEEKQRISFVTFHQSYSYEDFVEGIRPVMAGDAAEEGAPAENGISYECRPGVLRTLCALAKSAVKTQRHESGVDLVHGKVWKMSLGDVNQQGVAYLYDQCLELGEIRLGYGQQQDFTGCDDRDGVTARLREVDPDISPNDYNITSIHHFKNVMAAGDLVVVSDGNTKFRAIGRITGPYRYDPDQDFQNVRPVEWLATFDESLPYEKILRKRFSQMTLYQLSKKVLREDALQELLARDQSGVVENHVLIIDEINRGNIAKIFGELISLIEQDKRLGAPNELTAILPYSGERFGVPANLYIIGTMNTADRSIALLDTALRRRFQFAELMPEPALVPGANGDGTIADGVGGVVDLRAMLTAINQRIRFLLNRDQTIGHAYFIEVKTLDGLRRVMAQQVIPLLQEYFYEDWHRIQLVLRDVNPDGEKNAPQLVCHEKVSELEVLGYDHDDYDDSYEYRVTAELEMQPEAFRKIYES